MGIGKDIGQFIIILGYVVVLFVLVRPGSKGPQLIEKTTGGLSNLVRAATGGGKW